MHTIEEQLRSIRALLDTQELSGQALDKQVQDLEHAINDSQRRKALAMTQAARKDKWSRELVEEPRRLGRMEDL
jgi:hypothetical protein